MNNSDNYIKTLQALLDAFANFLNKSNGKVLLYVNAMKISELARELAENAENGDENNAELKISSFFKQLFNKN